MVEIVDKPQFSVIGKMGKGPAAEAPKWIAPLWQEANRSFAEIGSLAKLDAEGNVTGIWGAMSDIDENYDGWKEEGKYLAGCEVQDDALAPDGWTKWVVPAFKYATVKCTQDSYQETYRYMIAEYLPLNSYTIVGAVQEFYSSKDADGELSLYFPIVKL